MHRISGTSLVRVVANIVPIQILASRKSPETGIVQHKRLPSMEKKGKIG
jgi:hypothetical protein